MLTLVNLFSGHEHPCRELRVLLTFAFFKNLHLKIGCEDILCSQDIVHQRRVGIASVRTDPCCTILELLTRLSKFIRVEHLLVRLILLCQFIFAQQILPFHAKILKVINTQLLRTRKLNILAGIATNHCVLVGTNFAENGGRTFSHNFLIIIKLIT